MPGPDLHSVRAELIPIRPRRGLALLRRDNARYHRQHLTRLTAQAEQLADSTRALLDDLHADNIPGPCRGVAVALLRLRQAQEALDHATGKVEV